MKNKKPISETHKELIEKEWDYEKNNILGLDPTELTYGSGKKVGWKCEKGHRWEAPVSRRNAGNGCRKCADINETGKNNSRYNPELTDEDRMDRRQLPGYRAWRQNVYKRDNFTCQICNHKRGNLNAHHLMNYDKYVELRFDIDNGITLCKKCHNSFHKTYGRKNNTKKQFEEYQLSICKSINSIPILTH
jgi:5-methylcytosine-specific restriction endonuclease McrA